MELITVRRYSRRRTFYSLRKICKHLIDTRSCCAHMNDLSYIAIDKVNITDLMLIMNRQKVRTHLAAHVHFDEVSIKDWVRSKVSIDTVKGCKVRAILFKGKVAGWCGIQLEDGKYELAIVMSEAYWGLGKPVFRELLAWSKDMEHNEVYIHFLHTRPEYKFMRRISSEVHITQLLGNTFRSYKIRVS